VKTLFSRRSAPSASPVPAAPAAASPDPTHLSFHGYQIPVDLVLRTGGGPDTFDAISQGHIRNLNSQHPLRRDLDVFEMGCGIGRDAIPLTEVLTEGSYVGSDVIGASIAWCAAEITARHPHFTFVHQDLADQLHNPSGTVAQQVLPLPAADLSRDLVFAQSVFTHLLPEEFAYYLHEVARLLRPGGTAYLTAFVVDEEVLASAREDLERTPYALAFLTRHAPGCWINDPHHPTGAVAYSEQSVRAMVAQAGLRLRSQVLPGAWSGWHPVGFDGQDVLVLERA
jgi:SAM-dependent methyltransferase